MTVLVSACLLGVACRYDGASKGLPDSVLRELMARSERLGSRVVARTGADVTDAYTRGAQQTLAIAQRFGCTAALLKQRSPSCGKGEIYDGTFTGTLTPGDGVTAALLSAHGIRVYGEDDVVELLNL